MRRLTATLAMLLAACSAPTGGDGGSPADAQGIDARRLDAVRDVDCLSTAGVPDCDPADASGSPANCGIQDDPFYIWIPVCGPDWVFECSPDGTREWLTPCPACVRDDEVVCGIGQYPSCIPIPRDCAAGRYTGR